MPARNPSSDVVTKLAGAGLSLTAGTNLFSGPYRGEDSVIPDLAVFCTSTGGPAPSALIGGSVEERFYSVLVYIRSTPDAFGSGQTLARGVRDALHRGSVSPYLDVFVRETDPSYLGQDDKGHHEWSIGVTLEIDE